MTRTDTDLPFGDGFSPRQLETDGADELAETLEMVAEYEGRATAFNEAVAERSFPDINEPLERSKNIRLALWLACERGYTLENAIDTVCETGRWPLEGVTKDHLQDLLDACE